MSNMKDMKSNVDWGIGLVIVLSSLWIPLMLRLAQAGYLSLLPLLASFVWFSAEGAYRNLQPVDVISSKANEARRRVEKYWFIKQAVLMAFSVFILYLTR